MKLNKTLVKGSFVLIASFGIYNFFNFLFQLSMARMLSISDYSVLATIFSLLYALSVFTESIQIIMTKYSSTDKKEGEIKTLLKKSLKKSFKVSSILFALNLFLSLFLSYLLKIDYFLLVLGGMTIFSAFLLPVNRGVMQGRKKFGSLGLNMILESLTKLFFAVLFVYLGFKVYGAITGAILGFLIAFVLSFITLNNFINSKEERTKTEGIYSYAKPAFFVTTTIIIFYSLDIILARLFFDPEIAGAYAVASIISKTIFWGTQPISRAMLPISTENISNRKESKNIITSSFLILFLLIFIALFLFYFFPNLLVRTFSGKEILISSKILLYLGLGTSFLSLTNLLLLYNLSLGKIRNYKFLLIFLFIEVGLLFFFSEDILKFSVAFAVSSVVFFIGSFVLSNKNSQN